MSSTTAMPARTHHSAPKFDGEAQLLSNFFREIEQLAEPCKIDAQAKIAWAIRYAPLKVTDLWENQPSASGNDWEAFKDEIYDLYPGSQNERKYSVVDLEAVTDRQMKINMTTSAQFGEYYRDFTQIAFYLKKQGRLNDMLFSDKFIGGMDVAFRQRLRAQLHAEDPTHHPDDPYKISQIKKAALLILSASPAKRDEVAEPTVKKERFNVSELTKQMSGEGGYSMTMLAQEIAKFMAPQNTSQRPNTGYQGNAGYTNTGGQGYNGPPRSFECMFCSDPAHFLKHCPKAQEYIQNGKCRRSPEGQVVLPNGERPNPRVNFGRNLMERVDHWHAQNSGGNTLSANIIALDAGDKRGPAKQAVQPVRSQFVWTEVEDEEVTTDAEDNEIVLLEAMVLNAQKKIDDSRKRQKGPITRGAAARTSTEQANREIPSDKSMGGTPSMAEASIIKEGSGTPVRAKANNTGTMGQFRYITPIESSTITNKVTQNALEATVPLTVREIMAIAPDVRKNIKEQLLTKKVLTGTEANTAQANHVGQLQSYMAALPTRSDGIVVSNHSEKLRAIDVLVNGHRMMEAIMDEGSQIIAIRKDLWEELGLGVRSDYTVRMEAANQSVNSTIGLLQDLKFTIGGYDFYLQVQVVENASYEILLGLPFHVLTHLQTQFFGDGSSRITLTDPNTGANIMVPTKERRAVREKAEAKPDAGQELKDF